MTRRLLAVAALIGAAGCSSDRAFVANSAAARIYWEDRYERTCVEVKGPRTCKEWQAQLQSWKRANNVANEVQQLGRMPAAEKAELEALWKESERLASGPR